jgi:peptide/nickel transport system permease protein
LLQAIDNRDVPLVEGIVLVFGVIVVLVNLATDLLYGALDPRIRHGRSRS